RPVETGDDLLELPGGDLAGAPATTGVLGQTYRLHDLRLCRAGHQEWQASIRVAGDETYPPEEGRMTQRETAAQVLQEHGRTYAEEAGIRLKDTPAPLFQLLCLTQLFSAPIGAQVAVATMRELLDEGWTTPEHLLDSTWQQRVDALGRGGYRRYDESTATYLEESTQLVKDRWRGDLRRLRDAAEDEGEVRHLLQEVPRVGPARTSSAGRSRPSGRTCAPRSTPRSARARRPWACRPTPTTSPTSSTATTSRA